MNEPGTCSRCGAKAHYPEEVSTWATLVIFEYCVLRTLCDCCLSEVLEALKPPWEKKE